MPSFPWPYGHSIFSLCLYPERYINEEEEEDPDRPDSLEWSKKKDQYYTYNSIVSNPVLAKKGRKMLLLGALLLVAILVAVILIADATIPPAS